MQGASSIPPHASLRFERVDDLWQAFLPRPFASEAGGEFGFGEGGDDAGFGVRSKLLHLKQVCRTCVAWFVCVLL